jgi:hypothetical protein
MSDIRRRVQRLEQSGEDRRRLVRVRWREDIIDTGVEDTDDAEVIRLEWEPPG